MEGTRVRIVIGHASKVLLADCEFKVSQAGRRRVLRERKKNVHAGILATLVMGDWIGVPPDDEYYVESVDWDEPEGLVPITYDPYRFDTFVRRDNLQPVHRATLALCSTGVVVQDQDS